MKLIARLLIVSLFFFSFHATAGMIGTDQVATAGSASAERAYVQSILSRGDIVSGLQSMGVDPKMAADRVAAMTDEEVRTLHGKLQAVPAGAVSGWGVAAIILIVAFLVWWIWYRR